MSLRIAAAGWAVSGEVAGAFSALLLGAFMVFMVGFAGAEVLHEAAHNTRHSIAFPCH
jgi:cobalt transporter subunit CbtB